MGGKAPAGKGTLLGFQFVGDPFEDISTWPLPRRRPMGEMTLYRSSIAELEIALLSNRYPPDAAVPLRQRVARRLRAALESRSLDGRQRSGQGVPYEAGSRPVFH